MYMHGTDTSEGGNVYWAQSHDESALWMFVLVSALMNKLMANKINSYVDTIKIFSKLSILI